MSAEEEAMRGVVFTGERQLELMEFPDPTPGEGDVDHARMFRTLAAAKVNIEMISTAEIRITCLVARKDAERAVRALHSAFQLDQVA